MMKAVALRRSGLTSTEVTVILASRSSGSRMSPRSRSSASRWRISSPTRNWRWLWPRSSLSEERRLDMARLLLSLCLGGRSSRPLQGRLDLLDVEALDHVADLDVVVVLERHA